MALIALLSSMLLGVGLVSLNQRLDAALPLPPITRVAPDSYYSYPEYNLSLSIDVSGNDNRLEWK